LQFGLPQKIQEGIFYEKMSEFKKHGNHSCAVLFLRVLKGNDAHKVADALKKIWDLYQLLKKGILVDILPGRVPGGEISVLIGFSSEIFKIPKVKRMIPRDFDGKQFLPAIPGNPILEGCGINYSKQLFENVGTSEHILIQIVSETQVAAYRTIVETWNHLTDADKDENCLQLTKFYTGFQRDDGRSWLGFHDEISNMKDVKERKDAIAINKESNRLIPDDFWTENGTYMAFLRTEIDLNVWNRLGRKDQEIIIGRDKRTGSPIIGIDKSGNPIVVQNYRRSRHTEFYNAKFHDHPDYYNISSVSDMNKVEDIRRSRALLSQSHIGRVRHVSNLSSKDPTSRRIYRQGFEFIDYLSNGRRPFRLGQNFISFQNDPKRLIFILTDPRWMGNTNFGGSPDLFSDNLLSVLSAGMFFVPPKEKPFPGASIFY
jgi:deferrochelatase/peroxidase EfeB